MIDLSPPGPAKHVELQRIEGGHEHCSVARSMKSARSGIEVLLAGIAVATVSTFAACGGAVEGGSSSGSSGQAGSSGTGAGPSTGSGRREGGAGTETCENGLDPICGCKLPAPVTQSHPFEGPDAGAGEGDDAGLASDAGAWTCEDECETHHPNRNGTLTSCSFAPSAATPTDVTCAYFVRCVGRRPAELREPTLASVEMRDLLSAMAALEEASIGAFVRLARELAHHRAPAELVSRARDAARDEIRHTRSMRALAARFGADFEGVAGQRAKHRRAPRLVDILVENAIEGCVRETFGALMAHVQARIASDPVARRTMAEIAVDESRHAALAWAIDAWGSRRVSASDRRRIAAARAEAVRSLFREIERGPREVDGQEIGLVGADEARALATSLERHLWAAETQAAA